MKYDGVATNPIWRTTAYSKSYFGYISMSECLINAKFGVKKQNYVQTQVIMTKIQKSHIHHGGRPPFWKWFIAISHPGILWFQWYLMYRRKFWFHEPSRDSVPTFYTFKITDGRHTKNIFGYIITIYCSIYMKFRLKKQSHTLTQITWPLYKFSKIQDGVQYCSCMEHDCSNLRSDITSDSVVV